MYVTEALEHCNKILMKKKPRLWQEMDGGKKRNFRCNKRKNATQKEVKCRRYKTENHKLSKKMSRYEVTSEIFSEFDYNTSKTPKIKGNVISQFPFNYPQKSSEVNIDEDGDYIVDRQTQQNKTILIEHSISTKLELVGLQVWRGAFLLADLMLHWGHQGLLKDSTILELGAGTGITSIVAAMFAKRVVCTDIDMGGILDLIKLNVQLNKDVIKSNIIVAGLDFTKEFTPEIKTELKSVDIVIAADVIYDDSLTEAFVSVIEKLLNSPPKKRLLIALEKRYVFTLADLDSVAPCYETFLTLIDKAKIKNQRYEWKIKQIPIDFPQYFKYERVKELILWELSSGKS